MGEEVELGVTDPQGMGSSRSRQRETRSARQRCAERNAAATVAIGRLAHAAGRFERRGAGEPGLVNANGK